MGRRAVRAFGFVLAMLALAGCPGPNGGGVDADRRDGMSDGARWDGTGDALDRATDTNADGPAPIDGASDATVDVVDVEPCGDGLERCGPDDCDQDHDGHRSIACGGDDCDDNDSHRYPGNAEVCDAVGHDEDCDPCTVASSSDGDGDHDGFVAASCFDTFSGAAPTCAATTVTVDASRMRVTGTDCDDAHDAAHPGGTEICDGLDNDCNGTVDDVTTGGTTCYADADGDGYATATATITHTCGATCPSGTTSRAPTDPSTTDCDDSNPMGFLSVTGYPDADGDHHCTSGTPMTFCTDGTLPRGFGPDCSGGTTDCDDTSASAYTTVTGYPDADGDHHCTSGTAMTFCTNGSLPAGYGPNCSGGTFDCNDGNAGVWVNVTGYPDADGDHHCTSGSASTFCTNGSLPAGYSPDCSGGFSDCNDGNGSVWASVSGYHDGDGDGYCTGPSSTFCTNGSLPAGYRSSCTGYADCDDGNGGVWVGITPFRDGDGDRHCTSLQQYFCTNGTPPAGWRTAAGTPNGCVDYTDCDDTNPGGWTISNCDRDADGDGWCSSGPAPVCSNGSCPAGYHDPSTCILVDCNDANPYATSSCVSSQFSGNYGHCCCLGCGQPDPIVWDFSGDCGVGWHLDHCNAYHVSGGGPYGVAGDLGPNRFFTCSLYERCTLCEGVTAYLEAVCVPD